jgi:hypothetical protein
MNKETNLYIHSETFPLRCEVCHQIDYFDPVQNWCFRCKEIAANVESLEKEKFVNISVNTTFEIVTSLIKIGMLIGGICGLMVGFLWASAAQLDILLVLAILSLLIGPIAGLIFGLIFLLGITTLNGIERVKWRISGRRGSLQQI